MSAPRTLAVPGGLPLLIDRLRAVLGREHVDLSQAPHLRCLPATAAEVKEVVAVARLAEVRLSCQGAADALIHLDLRRLVGVVEHSDEGQWAELRAGTPLLLAEQHLQARGLTLGWLPPPSLQRALGAALAAPQAAEASFGRGRLRDQVLRLCAVLPGGEEARLPVALSPRRATGPDLKQLLLGSRGRVGVISSATLQVGRRPAHRACAGYVFAREQEAAALLRELVLLHGGVGLSDAQLWGGAALQRGLLALAPEAAGPAGAAALLLRWEGPPELVRALAQRAGELAGAAAPIEEGACGRLLGVEAAQDEGLRAALLSLWPPRQRRVGAAAPEELGALLREAGPAAILCGVHAHGAALCAETGDEPAGDGAALLLGALLPALDRELAGLLL